MFDFLKIENVPFILFFIVPGLIISFIRAQFIKNRVLTNSESVLSYLTISMIYHALVFPLFLIFIPEIIQLPSMKELIQLVHTNIGYTIFIFVIFVLIIPLVFGLLLGLNIQEEWIYSLLRRCKINPVHAVSTAWDWKFSIMREQWVLVTLKDDTKYAGYCDPESSFFSSEPTERDIYIEYVYNLDDDNKWEPIPGKSVLITGGEVKTIEFWQRKEEATSDEITEE